MRALLALLLSTSSAYANMPPPEFDHPFSGRLEQHSVPYGQAYRKCRTLGRNDVSAYIDGRHLYGCQFWRGDTCVIVYSFSRSDRKMASNVRRHEVAHCNGWEHD